MASSHGTVVLLADETAGLMVGGLSLLERLLRTLDESLEPDCPGYAAPPRVLVVWRSPDLLSNRPTLEGGRPLGLDIRDALDGTRPGPQDHPPDRPTLVLRSNLVVGRDVLPGLLGRLGDQPAAAAPTDEAIGGAADSPPFALVPGGLAAVAPDGTLRWDTLAALVPEGPKRSPTPAAGFWAVVRSPRDLAWVERALCRSLAKRSDGYVAKTVNRPISTWLTRLLSGTSVTPNQVSLAVLGVTLAGGWSLLQGTPEGFILGTVLFHLASVLDGCDGEIARLKFLESRRGAWLDTVIDLLGNQLFVVTLGIGLARQAGLTSELGEMYLWEAGLTLAGIVGSLWAVARYTRRTSGEAHFNHFGGRVLAEWLRPSLVRSALQTLGQLARRDSLALLCVGFALVGQPDWILHALALVVVMISPLIAWSIRKSGSAFSAPAGAD